MNQIGLREHTTRRKNWTLTVLIGLCIAVALATPSVFIYENWLAGWWFENRVAVGLTKQQVIERYGNGFRSYAADQHDELARALSSYEPRIDCSKAHEVMVYKVDLVERLGIVLLSDTGIVMNRVVVRT